MKKALIIVPAFNEAENIGDVLQGLLTPSLQADILVVDDGSLDDTRAIATRFPVSLVSHPCNLGYGAALRTGYKYALRGDYDFVVQFDADGQHHAEDAARILHAMRTEAPHLAIGTRFGGLMDFHPGALKTLGIRWFRWLILALTGHRISDPTSGLRGLSRQLVQYYAVSGSFPSDFPDADFVTDVLLNRWRVIEIPIGNRSRVSGRSMHAGWKPIVYVGKVTISTLAVALANLFRKRGISS